MNEDFVNGKLIKVFGYVREAMARLNKRFLSIDSPSPQDLHDMLDYLMISKVLEMFIKTTEDALTDFLKKESKEDKEMPDLDTEVDKILDGILEGKIDPKTLKPKNPGDA